MTKYSGKPASDMDELLSEMKGLLLQIYGEKLRGLYLYGSRLRREGTADSDVDVIIVLKDFDRYWTEIQRTSHIISDLSLKYGVSISPVRIREADWLTTDSPFLNVVRGESVAA